FDEDGPGPALPSLILGGAFGISTPAGLARGVVKWDGLGWSALGGGLDGPVYALQIFDEDGPGPMLPALFAGGQFHDPLPRSLHATVARFTGGAWTMLPHWPALVGTPECRALAAFDQDGTGPATEAL